MTPQDEIIEMAKQAGLLDMDYEIGQWEIHEFTIFAKLVAEAEREACALLVEANADACRSDGVAQMCLYSNVTAIRARGGKT